MCLPVSLIHANMTRMEDETKAVADKVRGVAAEKRASQDAIARELSLSRQAVSARMTGKVAFTAPEVLTLSKALGVPVSRFFPDEAAAA